MPVTGPWLRLDVKDDWHFCQNCRYYPPPQKPVELSYTRPTTGTICIWCRGLVAKGTCS